VSFGLVSADDLKAAGADTFSSSSESTATTEDAVQASQLIARLCYMQLPQQQQGDASAEELSDVVNNWVDRLSHDAAAAALFSTWYWSTPAAAAAAVKGVLGVHLPSASSIGVLGLSLYAAARDGRPSLSSLLLDLGLTAAAGARDWDRGALPTHYHL
jgi:hypothetical protein